jgi:anti-sigma factor RsiW
MTHPIHHCLEDGQLQAYLDNQLDTEKQRQVKRHLAECTSCHLRLEELRQLDEWFQHVNFGVPKTSDMNSKGSIIQDGTDAFEEPVDTADAWRRFLKRVNAESHPTDACETASGEEKPLPAPETNRREPHVSAEHLVPAESSKKRKITDERKRQMKKWTVTAAAILVGGALLANPGIRSAAADMLNVFRVENLNTVKMSAQELDKISIELETKVGDIDLRDYGKAEVLARSKHAFISPHDNPEQYAAVAKTLPSLPASIVNGLEQEIHQFTADKIRFALDVENVNRLIRALGGEKVLPPELQGESLLFTFPGGYEIQWYQKVEHQDGTVFQDIGYQLAVRGLPKLETSAAVNMKTLQEALISLPFLSYDVKRQLADIQRFTNTMLMPQLLEAGEEKVDIEGHQALYKGNGGREKGHHELIWIADGKLIRFSGFDVSKDAFLKATRSIQWPNN